MYHLLESYLLLSLNDGNIYCKLILKDFILFSRALYDEIQMPALLFLNFHSIPFRFFADLIPFISR